jgi:hypothetical protein
MLRGYQLLAGVCALAALGFAGTASAQGMPGLHAVAGGGYVNTEVGGVNADGWAVGGGAILGGMGFGGEAVLGYGSVSAGGGSADAWTTGGGLFYRTMEYAVGGGLQYTSIDIGGPNVHVTNYGVAGEFYPSEMITLAAGGGGFTGTGGADGWNIGGGATFYITPDVAVDAGVGYADASGGGDATNVGVGFEVMPFDFPISLSGGYDYSDSGGPGVNTWSIGLNVYLGTPGDGTLVSNHRHGGVYLTRGVDLSF